MDFERETAAMNRTASLILIVAGYGLLVYAIGPRPTAFLLGLHLIWAGID